jgi:Protein of unknown function (DUF3098)
MPVMNKKETKPVAHATAPATVGTAAALKKETKKGVVDFAFGRENYVLMLIGIGLIVLGFILMSGGGAGNPAEWNPDIFSFRRITLAPVLVILGFVVEVIAIVKKSKD